MKASVDKPYVKALLFRNKFFLQKCATTKNSKSLKTILDKATLPELNILLRVFFLVVHHHIFVPGKLSTQIKKKLVAIFLEETSLQKLLWSSRDIKKKFFSSSLEVSIPFLEHFFMKHEQSCNQTIFKKLFVFQQWTYSFDSFPQKKLYNSRAKC